jgi:tetratricopeptide (TPR) repeat protein
MPQEMDDRTFERITELTSKGNELAGLGQYHAAKELFFDALDLIPEPKTQWEATTWILASIGDIWFFLKNYEKAGYAFSDAIRCPGGLGNSFIHLRLGQIAFEVHEKSRALNELTRAYMGGGRDAFAREDPKYFALLEANLKPPAGKSQL